MLSMRTFFLLGVTVYLLPSDPARQDAFMKSASKAFEYTTTVCEREPQFCARANSVYEDLKSKAHFGAGVVYTLVTSYQPSGEVEAEEADGRPALPASTSRWDGTTRRMPTNRGTLKPGDLAPAWRGSTGNSHAISYE
jgi:hypothetical protein